MGQGVEGWENPGVKGVVSLREAGNERVGSGIPKVVGTGRNRKKMSQYFAIGKEQRDGSQLGRNGNGKQEV